MNITKKQKSYITLFFLILFPCLAIFVIAQDNPLEIIDGNDIIEHFRFDSYTDANKGVFTSQSAIDQGKLQIQEGGWNIKDFEILGATTIGDETELTYLLNLTNVIYAYTSVPITESYSTASTGSQRTTTYTAATYDPSPPPGVYIATIAVFNHYYHDFGDVVAWNSIGYKHIWTGEAKYLFDISDTPFLTPLTGTDGTTFTPAFSYISVYDARISDHDNGAITEADVQDIVTIPYGDSDIPESASVSGASGSATYPASPPKMGLTTGVWAWTIFPDSTFGFSEPVAKNSFAGSAVPTLRNTPLDVTNGDGSEISKTENMVDGILTLPIGRINPSVIPYYRTLTYRENHLYSQYVYDFPFSFHYEYTSDFTDCGIEKQSSLEIINRYIKYEVSMELLVRTKYDLSVIRQIGEVEKPVEYYYDLIYGSGVGGAIQGTVAEKPSGADLLGTIWNWLILFIVLIAVVLIIRKIAKSRSGSNKQTVYVNLPKSNN